MTITYHPEMIQGITEPGLHPHLTPTEYFAEPCPAPALTNSTITKLKDETPADAAYHHPAINPDKIDPDGSAAKRQGDIVHQLALGKGRGYAIGDFADWRTKAAQEFKAQAEADKLTPVTASKFAECERMADVVRQRIEAELNTIGRERGLTGPFEYQTEVVFAWQEQTTHGSIWCRGMLDVWCPSLHVALDPKITDRLVERRVRSHMENMGWDQQAVWYERGLNRIFPEQAGRIIFADLMVRPKPPHTFRAVSPSEAWRAAITPDIERAIETWGRCLATNDWPGYAPGIEMLEPTPWKIKAAMERELEDELSDENTLDERF